MLVVGLVTMQQTLVLYVTILVISAVLGFAVCPCLVMAVFNVRANYIQMFTDKVSPILLKEKYFYGIFSYKIDLKQLKKEFRGTPFRIGRKQVFGHLTGEINNVFFISFSYERARPIDPLLYLGPGWSKNMIFPNTYYGVNMIFTFPRSFSHPLLIKRRGEDLGL